MQNQIQNQTANLYICLKSLKNIKSNTDTHAYTCNIVESTYRVIDMTVERNGNIMDNLVVTPRNIRDKISYR
jgi:hypothetical protein